MQNLPKKVTWLSFVLFLLTSFLLPATSDCQVVPNANSLLHRKKTAIDKSLVKQNNPLLPVPSALPFIITDADATTNSLASIIQSLVGPGVTVSGITTNLPATSDIYGSFIGGTSVVGMEKGLVITNGSNANARGPNFSTSAGRDNFLPGYAPLDSLSTATGFDASYITFNIIPTANTIGFKYSFSSEEYNEYVNSTYNDVFGFFISGPGITGTQNIALIPGTTIPVAINNVNKGIFSTNEPASNPQYYINNTDVDPPLIPQPADSTRLANLEHDGLTVVLNAIINVIPGNVYTLTLAIQDVGDGVFDSGVFLEGGSITSLISQKITFGPLPNRVVGDPPFALTATASSGLPVSYTVISGPATIAGNIVTITGPGTVVIEANQAGNTIYAPAPPVTQSFNVSALTVASLSLTPASGTATVGTVQCFDALVLDQFNNPVPGIQVAFSVLGFNPGNTGNAITDLNGIASFCYTGANPGIDSVIASAGIINDTSLFTWTNTTCNISLSFTSVNVSCKAGSNGAIDLTVIGGTPPYQYAWSNGATTEDLTGLTAGSYTVTVTDANNCTATITITISEPAIQLQAISSAGIISCNGGTTTVTVTAAGGTSPYSGTGTFTAGAGNYSYTVIDSNGCTATTTGTIAQPPSPVSCSISVSPNPTIPGGALNTIYIGNGPQSVTLTGTGSGGAGTYSYNWGAAGTGMSIIVSPTATTTYTLTVTDSNQCASTCSVTINVIPSGPVCGENSVSCSIQVIPNPYMPEDERNTIYIGYGLPCLTLKAIVHGGTAPYTYTWSGGEKLGYDWLRKVCPKITTTYTLTVKDANGCTSTCTVTIRVVDVRCGEKMDGVSLCYKNQEICVSKGEVFAYLVQGAKLGRCKIIDDIPSFYSGISTSLKAFPNPAKNYLIVQWNSGYNEISVLKVIDMQGRVLITKQYSGLLKGGINIKRLELSGFGKGMYLLQVTGKKGLKTIKFNVE